MSYHSWVDDFQLAQLFRFFNQSIYPFRHAKYHVNFHGIIFDLYRPTTKICTGWDSHPATVILCRMIGWYSFPAERVALALEDVPGEMVTEVMPSLKGSV